VNVVTILDKHKQAADNVYVDMQTWRAILASQETDKGYDTIKNYWIQKKHRLSSD